jgi:hypothetical protein
VDSRTPAYGRAHPGRAPEDVGEAVPADRPQTLDHGYGPRPGTGSPPALPMVDQPTPPFQQLDFVYTPSRDVAADLAYFTQILGGHVVFAVQAMAARVAAIELTPGPPLLLLADHLGGERPILVYRVADLDAALAELEAHGWQRQQTLEIPHGPCCSFRSPGGHQIALYQLTRPEVATHFEGRRDF